MKSLAAALLAMSLSHAALAADSNEYDHQFLQTAAEAGSTEMASGALAASKHAAPAIKAFAAAMDKDHGWVAVASKQLLAEKAISVSHAPNQAEIDALDKLDGREFDQRYASLAVAGHKQTLDLFTDASQHALDPEVRAFAARMVPQVQRHYAMALALQATLTAPGPQLIDLNALNFNNLPATDNPTMHAQTFYSTANGAIGIQAGNTRKHIHLHNDEIQYIISGSGSMWVGNQRRDIKPGTLIVLPPGTPHGDYIISSDSPIKALTIKMPPWRAGDTLPVN